MREISPAIGISANTWLEHSNPVVRKAVSEIRRQKLAGHRPKPSTHLIDKSTLLTESQRKGLLDKVAELVDENCCGRSEMCQQFAALMYKALTCLGFPARIVTGTVVYYNSKGETLFRWPDDGHDWVCVDDEIIDGNLDSLVENPFVPEEVKARPYWGPRKETPRDSKYIENPGARMRETDEDVNKLWWPELELWIHQNIQLQ